MRKNLLTLMALFFLINSIAQKTQFRVSLNSGLFSFSGQSAENTSFINYSNATNRAYTNNPYGSKSGLCYGLSANIQRVSKKNFIAGLDLGYEILKSKIFINGISGYSGSSTASGQTFLKYNFINLAPFSGFRLDSKNLSFNFIGALDIAFSLKAMENGNATSGDGKKFITSVDRQTIKTDIRPRIQLSTEYKNIGIYLGYSYGLLNYMSGYVGGTNECYARLLRFGLTYQIN